MSKTYEQWLDEISRKNALAAQEKIDSYNRAIDDNIKAVTADYDSKIGQTKEDYESYYDLNEIQRYIDKREIANAMADMGISDSGLNRTQQTAVQLSYSDRKSRIEAKERSAVDSLKQQLADYVADAAMKKTENAISTKQKYESDAAATAQKLYQAELNAEAEKAKSAAKAAASASKSSSSKSSSSKSSSSGSSKKDSALKTLKSDITAMYKRSKGRYTNSEMTTIFNKIKSVENKYTLSDFECLVLLEMAGIDYDKYTYWKKNGKLKSGTGIGTITIAPPSWLK